MADLIDETNGQIYQNKGSKGYIEEYRELRAEIRLYLDRRTKTSQIAFVFVIAIIGLYESIDSPYLYLSASLVMAFIWYDQIRQLRAVSRIATYLQLFVEPKVEGLKWETYSTHHPFTMRKGTIWNFLDRVMWKDPFPIFFFLGAAAILDKTDSWRYPVWIVVAIVIVLLVLLFFFFKSYNLLDREKQLEVWREVQKDSVKMG